jgi:hypothetical protein
LWQKQRPPQSIVPGWQFAVQTMSLHEGALLAATHMVGWQQVAGTQSESVLQRSDPSTKCAEPHAATDPATASKLKMLLLK